MRGGNFLQINLALWENTIHRSGFGARTQREIVIKSGNQKFRCAEFLNKLDQSTNRVRTSSFTINEKIFSQSQENVRK